MKYHSFLQKILASFLIVGTLLISSFSGLPKQTFAQTSPTSFECDDGIDNDNDGYTDYPDDADCFAYEGAESSPVYTAPTPVAPVRPNITTLTKHEYKVPGTYSFSVPAGYDKVSVKVWGAGGGGGSGVKVPKHNVSGFGGGGGGYAEHEFYAVPGDTYNVVVGAGGLWGEGGGNSEVSIDGTVIVGAGGGGGGVSIGGPGYSTSNGWITIVGIVVAVVLAVVTYGALSGVSSAVSAGVNTTVATTGATTGTAAVSSGVVSTAVSYVPSAAFATAELSATLPAFTVTATSLATPAAITGVSTIGATVASTLTTAAVSGLGGMGAMRVVSQVAQNLAKRGDTSKPGGVDGFAGYGFGGIRGAEGGGGAGRWVKSCAPRYSPQPNVNQLYYLEPNLTDLLSIITFAKQAFAQTINTCNPVYGKGGDGYAGSIKQKGSNGGYYRFDGENSEASEGGNAANGGRGGCPGRRGRDGAGHGARTVRCDYIGRVSEQLPNNESSNRNDPRLRTEDGFFPGGGGGGSETGMGGYGGDGQVIVEFQKSGSGNDLPQCRDGQDNDNDAFIDFPLDPGCSDPNDDDETNACVPLAPGVCVLGEGAAPTISLSCPSSLKVNQSGDFKATVNDSDEGEVLNVRFGWGGVEITDRVNIAPGAEVGENKAWASSGTKTVTATVIDRTGLQSSASCNVSVTATRVIALALAADKPVVDSGQAVELQWAPINADSCEASAQPTNSAWSGSKAATQILHTQMSSPLAAATTFTLSCTNTDGDSSVQSVSIGVNACLSNCDSGDDGDGGATDVCSNIPGVQASVPVGMIQSGDQCVTPAVDPDFTMSGDSKVGIRFIGPQAAETSQKTISVNSVYDFSAPVRVSVSSVVNKETGASLPTDVVMSVSFLGGAYESVGSAARTVSFVSGVAPLPFKLMFSAPITDVYTVTFVGTGGGKTRSYSIDVDPNALNPDFNEI